MNTIRQEVTRLVINIHSRNSYKVNWLWDTPAPHRGDSHMAVKISVLNMNHP